MDEHVNNIKRFIIENEKQKYVKNCINFQLNRMDLQKVGKNKI